MEVNVKELLKDIKTNHKQCSSSQKDEVKVMQAMLNDTSYEVDIYDATGKIDTYNPAKSFREMQTRIVATAATITKDEAAKLMDEYEVTKQDAAVMVNISKEFVNTYLDSGRKLDFGGRDCHKYTLAAKDVPKTEKVYHVATPKEDGEPSWEQRTKIVPAHRSLKAKSTCPSWVK